jgi:histone acetyltransferase (RNA polymerase elongator complex component)
VEILALIGLTMSPRKMIYPVFLPHAGCPFRCIYCNQRAVVAGDQPGTGLMDLVKAHLTAYAEQIAGTGRTGEVAFFGGTFTALKPTVMESILAAASVHVERGIFTGIRFSTRPDCLGGEIIDLLSKFRVRTVELGVQSLSDHVLQESLRGYRAASVHDAANRIRNAGWSLGIQLMAGLPGDTPATFMESMHQAVEIGPEFLRIYPTLVLEGTALAESYRKMRYTPLSLDEAVTWVAAAYSVALGARIPIIRMGLHSDRSLEKPGVVLAGPYHPAFGHMVKSRWWRDRLDRDFEASSQIEGPEYTLKVPLNLVSEIVGHGKSNLRHWKSRWGISVKVVSDSSPVGGRMPVEGNWEAGVLTGMKG